jgi:DNA processing protein
MDRDELAGWLRLTLTPGVGNGTARRLLAAFGLPETIFEQPEGALTQCVTPSQARALRLVPDGLAQQLETTWAWLQDTAPDGPARVFLTLGDGRYPQALLDTEDPPLALYGIGPSAMWAANPFPAGRCLAIVGSRNPTAQGADNARQFARALHAAGLTIVSGLARAWTPPHTKEPWTARWPMSTLPPRLPWWARDLTGCTPVRTWDLRGALPPTAS